MVNLIDRSIQTLLQTTIESLPATVISKSLSVIYYVLGQMCGFLWRCVGLPESDVVSWN